MKFNFPDKIRVVALAILQIFIFYFWYQSVVKNGILVFNNIGIVEVWFLPFAMLLFFVLNLFFSFFLFRGNYFLKTFFVFFSFLIIILELVILAYYITIA